MLWKSLFGLVIVGVIHSSASALIIDEQGRVTDWYDLTFSTDIQANVHDAQTGMFSTYANNYAPIDYPSGVGHQPSPGRNKGEKYDLEQMHVRVTDDTMQILVMHSSDLKADGGIRLGDLFLSFGEQKFGVVTQSGNTGLDAGGVFRVDDEASDTLTFQPGVNSYEGWNKKRNNDYGPAASVGDIVEHWALDGDISLDQWVGEAMIETGAYDYGNVAGKKESNTHFIEYTLDLGVLALPTEDLDFLAQLTWGCGNDEIRVAGEFNFDPPGPNPEIPEPATMMLSVLGAALLLPKRPRQLH